MEKVATANFLPPGENTVPKVARQDYRPSRKPSGRFHTASHDPAVFDLSLNSFETHPFRFMLCVFFRITNITLSASHLIQQRAIVRRIGRVHQNDLVDDFHRALFIALSSRASPNLSKWGRLRRCGRPMRCNKAALGALFNNGWSSCSADEVFKEGQGGFLFALAFEVGDIGFQFAHGAICLPHTHIQLDQLFTRGIIVRGDGADLLEDAQRLLPVEPLHVDVCHTLEDVTVPIAAGASLLDEAQGVGISFARHVEFCEPVMDGGKFEVFLDGVVDLSARHKLVDQAVARAENPSERFG